MLIEFTLGNFKSFRDKTTFSMIAANLTSEDPALDRDNVIPIRKNLSLLKTAALYGANASGKSNFGVALRFLRDFVLDSAREATTPGEIGAEPFLLNQKSREQPSYFEVVFLLDGKQFRYGFEVDKSHVISEWLFHVPKTKEVALFFREGQEITVKSGLSGAKGLETRTRKEALFLSVAALLNVPFALKIQKWVQDFVVATGLQDEEFRSYTIDCMRDEASRKDLVNFLKTFDLGFDDIRVADLPTIETVLTGIPEELKPSFRKSFTESMMVAHDVEDDEGNVVFTQVFDANVNESQGTRKMIALGGPLLSILANGQLMFIDELDARLHPLMTRRIIEMFQSPLTNPKGAQLIFATHDTNLLDKSLFRRDQIWFAEKDREGSTHLNSLVEYKVRNDAAYEKNYLEGRYGAIPFLGDLTRLPLATDKETPEIAADRERVYA